MFEHVGVKFYDAFFNKMHDLLTPNGVALLHTIGRTNEPGATGAWTAKYIFPGGYSPAISEVTATASSRVITRESNHSLRSP